MKKGKLLIISGFSGVSVPTSELLFFLFLCLLKRPELKFFPALQTSHRAPNEFRITDPVRV